MVTLETIAAKLGWNLFNIATGKGIAKGWSKLTQPEYKKYTKCLNPPLRAAFKKTCELFLDNENSPFLIKSEILKNLYDLDDIKLNLIFSKKNLSIDQFSNEDCFNFIKKSLRNYIENQFEENIEDDFYDLWVKVLEENYKQKFLEFCKQDAIHFRIFATEVLGLSLNEFNALKSMLTNALIGINKIDKGIEELKSDNKEIKEILLDLQTGSKSLQKDILIYEIEEKAFEEDENIKNIKMFIEKCHHQSCIDYIDSKLNDKKNIFSNKLKSELLNYKGNCQFSLGDYNNAEITYKKAIEVFNENDKSISNLYKCYLNTGQMDKVIDCVNQFNDKTSSLYLEAKFYELFHVKNDIEAAEKYLEINKNDIENYNLLKSNILTRKLAPYEEIISYTEKYIRANPTHKLAKYELARMKFSQIFENKRIQFSFGITYDDKIDVLPVINESLNTELVDNLIKLIEELLGFEYTHSINLALKIMLAILHSQKKDLSIGEKYLSELNLYKDTLKDGFDINNACTLYFLLKKFNEAYELYQKYLIDDFNDHGIYIILNFALKKYHECLELIDKTGINSLELIKIISLYKVTKWDELFLYYKDNYHEFELNNKLVILDFCYEQKAYKFCEEKYKELANQIIQDDIYLHAEAILMISGRLDFFKQNSLKEKMVEHYWNKFANEESFEVGLSCAIKFLNAKKYSDCLEILHKLSEFKPEHSKVQELYVFIDLSNYAYKSIIERYESGKKENSLLYYVALAYINEKEFDKAEEVIENLKYVDEDKVKYFISKSGIYYQTENYKALFEILQEAYEKCPDSLEIKQQIFGMILSLPEGVKPPSDFVPLYHKVIDELTQKNIVHKISISKETLFEDLKKAMEEFNPLDNDLKREENFKEIYNGYIDFKYPIQLLYSFFSARSRIEVFSDMLLNPYEKININLCDNDISKKEISIIDRKKKILIDIETLLLMKELDIDLKAKEILNLHISNFTEREIKIHIDEQKSASKKEGTLGRTKEGNPQYLPNPKLYKKYNEFLKSVLAIYPRLSFDASSKKGLNLIRANEQFKKISLFNEAIIGMQNEDTIVCIDGILSRVYDEFGVKTTSTVSIIEYLYQQKILSYGKYYQVKLKLCKLNCQYVPISADDLYHALMDNYEDFSTILNSFSHKRFTIDSHAGVMTAFIVKLDQDGEIRTDVKSRAIREILKNICSLYPDYSLLGDFLIQLSPEFIHFKNEIQFIFTTSMCNVIGEKLFLGFYNSLISALCQNEHQQVIADKIELYLEKLVLNAPVAYRDAFQENIQEKYNHLKPIQDERKDKKHKS